MGGGLVGQAVARVEDQRILTGEGHYIDDVQLPGMLHAVFVRSQMPHARISSLDASEARQAPGVKAVITGEEIAGATTPLRFPVEFPGLLRPTFAPLATDKVRHFGDPVAIVVAESRYAAEDAAELVLVDYEPLEAVSTVDHARDPERPLLFEDLGSNRSYEESRTFGDPDAAFAAADHVVRLTVDQQRVTHVPIETRGVVADYRPGTDELVFYASCQGPHHQKMQLAEVLGHPAEKIRVISPDVGGSFGQKSLINREDLAVAFASTRLGRPVKWVEDRVENLTTATQAREDTAEVAAAVTAEGVVHALDVHLVMNGGAYPLAPYPPAFITFVIRTLMPGPYRIDNLRWHAEVFSTNRGTYGPYRGPWAVETFLRERLMDTIAVDLRLDPVEVRRRNLRTLEEQPCKLVTGPTVEGMSAAVTLQRAAETIDFDSFRAEQRTAREAGRLLGVGVSTFMEPAPGPADYPESVGFPMPDERAYARLEPDGHLTVVVAQNPHGQGHETTLAQVAADEFGLPMNHVRIVYGDTDVTPFHPFGTGGSRSAPQAGGVVKYVSRELRAATLEFAGDVLEITPEDLEITDGMVVPKGAPQRGVSLAEIGAATYINPPAGKEPGLRTFFSFRGPKRGGWAQATHVCFVEVDAETGIVTIPRYVVVEDCGSIINPGIVDGQIRGGVAQAVGQVLLEHAEYAEDGTTLASTFLDYLVPTAVEVPALEIEHLELETMDEDVNYRGVGEGGLIAAPAAIANAVSDALGGAPTNRLPLTPDRVLDLMAAAEVVS